MIPTKNQPSFVSANFINKTPQNESSTRVYSSSILNKIVSTKASERDAYISHFLQIIGASNFIRWRGIDEWFTLLTFMSPELRDHMVKQIQPLPPTIATTKIDQELVASVLDIFEFIRIVSETTDPWSQDDIDTKMYEVLYKCASKNDYLPFIYSAQAVLGTDLWLRVINSMSLEAQKRYWLSIIQIPQAPINPLLSIDDLFPFQDTPDYRAQLSSEAIKKAGGAAKYINNYGIDWFFTALNNLPIPERKLLFAELAAQFKIIDYLPITNHNDIAFTLERLYNGSLTGGDATESAKRAFGTFVIFQAPFTNEALKVYASNFQALSWERSLGTQLLLPPPREKAPYKDLMIELGNLIMCSTDAITERELSVLFYEWVTPANANIIWQRLKQELITQPDALGMALSNLIAKYKHINADPHFLVHLESTLEESPLEAIKRALLNSIKSGNIQLASTIKGALINKYIGKAFGSEDSFLKFENFFLNDIFNFIFQNFDKYKTYDQNEWSMLIDSLISTLTAYNEPGNNPLRWLNLMQQHEWVAKESEIFKAAAKWIGPQQLVTLLCKNLSKIEESIDNALFDGFFMRNFNTLQNFITDELVESNEFANSDNLELLKLNVRLARPQPRPQPQPQPH